VRKPERMRTFGRYKGIILKWILKEEIGCKMDSAGS
jgi:hypothetical protein